MGTIFNLAGFSQGKPGIGDRMPAAAGKFYPADEQELKSVLKTLFSEAKPAGFDNIAAIVCPHAGYIFSGRVAASGYNQVDPDKKYDNVFVIASSHQVSFDGASVYTEGDYITPLGKVKVNTEVAKQLIKNNKVFCFNPTADKTEHSTEVQIPFLQYHLKKEFKLVPVVIGTQSAETCKLIAKALAPYFNERNLFVFSTDFSHYPSYNDATATDKTTCDAIVSGSSAVLGKILVEYRDKPIPNLATNLCGWTSILTLLDLTEQNTGIKIVPVHYMNSGDTEYGDKKQVVGYWSLAITRETSGFNFSPEEKAALLALARKTIEDHLNGKDIRDIDTIFPGDNLNINAGAFVTLKEHGELRGCIGNFRADQPLYRTIRQMAIAAATQDSRFEPVTADELSSVTIEISVLSPMRKISSVSEITLGKHGIYIKKGYNSGTFLPQVATEFGWTLDEFLGHCARDKAGIGWAGWKNAEIFIYEAAIFSEEDITGSKD